MNTSKVFKYELINIVRNRWVFFFCIGMATLSISFLKISGNASKALLSLSEVLSLLVPLAAGLFAAVYWYYSDRFTEILLTQPIERRSLLLARGMALLCVWLATLVLGVVLPFVLWGELGVGTLVVLGLILFLALVFTLLGIAIATWISDRMRGIGVILGVWLYFALLHDGLVLLILLAFRDYPLDGIAGALSALNPIGLVRVIHLIHFDAALLLSYSGALMRHLISGGLGMGISAAVGVLWVVLPLSFAWISFRDRDF